MFIKEQSVVGNSEAQEIYGDKFGQYATMVIEEVGSGQNKGMLHVITEKHEYLEDGVIGEMGWVDASLMVSADQVAIFGDSITEAVKVVEPTNPVGVIEFATVSASTRRRRRR
jgi:hypothetical protein